MKTSIFAALAALCAVFAGCQANHERHRQLLVDFNGTHHEPIYLCAYGAPVDTATLTDGVYTFGTQHLPYGIYTLRLDSAASIDIIIDDTRRLMLCGTAQNTSGITTNSRETQLLWTANSLQQQLTTVCDTIVARNQPLTVAANRQRAAAQINKAIADTRLIADSILMRTEPSAAHMRLLTIAYGKRHLYTATHNYALLHQYANTLRDKYKGNEQIEQFAQSVESQRDMARAIKRYSCGAVAPQFELITTKGDTITSASLAGTQYILFATADSTKEAADMYTYIMQQRYAGYKVIAQAPRSILTPYTYNAHIGTSAHFADTLLHSLKPLAVSVANDGTIKRIEPIAALADIDGKW